tara:strand:+ start:1066 stop:1266 length:201 start_codon:yes stop_codon:yes gene_type:complete
MSSASEDAGARGGMPRRSSVDKKKLLLRIDPDTHRSLKLWANDEFRSLNSHIEFLLKKALAESRRE